ncbi:MAG: hypothetical protein CMB99_13905 [Flavobacteriaceae bacterium]|nr:hypothetical protein [Flavobacteriaceae bacterium]|tara:strand:- start:64607 stop:65260 length:654 start_codon:yes stop_codon:yes gene_type:complete
MLKKGFASFVLIFFFFLLACTPNSTPVVETCDITFCDNNGVLTDCACECPDGYSGVNCEFLNPAFVQTFLDDGLTPFELLNKNIPLDSIYGKNYQGGIIFHLNIVDQVVKVTVNKDLEEDLRWPNAIDYSNNLSTQSYSDWYLPEIEELQEMRVILYQKLQKGQFEDDFYWSSETVDGSPDDAYGVFFPNGNVGPIEKDRQNDVSLNYVRPARRIQL